MIDNTPAETPAPALPPPTFTEVLRNPGLLASRRSELVQLATARANQLAAVARTRFASAQTDALVRVQDLRKATACALQALATRVEPNHDAAAKAPKSDA